VSAAAISVAVIDGPYDATALEHILAKAPVALGVARCSTSANSSCNHGTFIMGLLGARRDVMFPGICPDCRLLHIPLFLGEDDEYASVAELAGAITVAVAAGANLINLSLASLGDDARYDPELASALDGAEASGAVVLAAAGNQGHLALGQLLSHRVTVPVVAVDAAGRLVPGCNFGPSISLGVAALGHEVPGYAPGGSTTVMSGSSVATAVATGTLALAWAQRPNATGAEIRTAIARQIPRNGRMPPVLEEGIFLTALDRTEVASITAASEAERGNINYKWRRGGTTMRITDDPPISLNGRGGRTATPGNVVTPAQSPSGCACGASGVQCTCGDGSTGLSFVYVLGSVDILFPDPSISWELQEAARTLKIQEPKATKSKGQNDVTIRDWYFRILKLPEARYIARQVSWILTVERQPAYYLALRDQEDLPNLINCLNHPEHDFDLFVGSSSLIPATITQGFTAPVLTVNQIGYFNTDDLLKAIKTSPASSPKQAGSSSNVPSLGADEFRAFYEKIVQSADNFGNTDDWRALNYLAVRYLPLYQTCIEMVHKGYSLGGVQVTNSRLLRENRIVDTIFSFNNTTGGVQKYFARVDVTHLFPMIVNHIAEYFDR
jgi:PatG C-terminal/Subtilase family